MMTRNNFKELWAIAVYHAVGMKLPPYLVFGHSLSLWGLDENV